MKKPAPTTLVLCFLASVAFGQNAKYYTFSGRHLENNMEWVMGISLYDSSFVIYNYSTYDNDQVWEDEVFSGKYHCICDTLYMSEARKELEFRMLKNGDSISAIKGLSVWDKACFTFFHDIIETRSFQQNDAFVLENLRKNAKQDNAQHGLAIGTYCFRTTFPFYSRLTIHEDMSYTYHNGHDILISKGRVEREGNLLMFYDYNMDTPFHVLIEEDGLRSCLLPDDPSILPNDYDWETYDTIPLPKGVLKR